MNDAKRAMELRDRARRLKRRVLGLAGGAKMPRSGRDAAPAPKPDNSVNFRHGNNLAAG